MFKGFAPFWVYSLLLVGLFSCKKFTEISPLSSLAESTAFTDPAKIELVANGMYEQAAVGSYAGGGGRGYPFGAASIEQAEMRGEDMVNLATFYAITYQSTQNATSANNVNHWEQLYALINQANVLITGVTGAVSSGIITSDVGNAYEAEGRFIRALSHHELLIHFCKPYAEGKGGQLGVPYREVAVNSPAAVNEGLALGRGTVAEDYAKILEDLDYAEANLPEKQTNGVARPTKGAAIALKTRIKLHMGDWAGVIAEGTKLGTGVTSGAFSSPIGGYKLESDPAVPFASFANNSESIFSIANSASSNGGVNGALPAMLGPSDQGARGLVATSPNLYNASFWVTGDKRRSELQVLNTNDGLYYTYKYRDYTTRTDWAPIIRYAEVLLNVAEAYSRTGNTAQALRLLNAVRDRSVPDANKFTTAPANLTLAILQERRIEFAAEGRRWPDIHRLALDPNYGLGGGAGIPAKLNPTQISNSSYNVETRPYITPGRAAIAYSDYRFLWPIPTSEISSNPTLADQQNPGY
ncbi:hypothetical protein A8C56_15515 [Niabella ginsenosidivorans]|uniref:Carbohydrate-binding protein SusD n=2 Tax=Niabella ginsenosidivorans TaxID=1176587 RepID=A0A1A9IBP0_9BACT|nr:hypothetical protein A8C56_15515 [Niabella ginsenosidivorans]